MYVESIMIKAEVGAASVAVALVVPVICMNQPYDVNYESIRGLKKESLLSQWGQPRLPMLYLRVIPTIYAPSKSCVRLLEG